MRHKLTTGLWVTQFVIDYCKEDTGTEKTTFPETNKSARVSFVFSLAGTRVKL